MKILGIINAVSDVTDQLLIRFSAFVTYWRKDGSKLDSISASHKLQESL
jgi:hypothetical protein